jgi:hypothetical protein
MAMISRERLRQGMLHAKRRVPEWHYPKENPILPYRLSGETNEDCYQRHLRFARKTTKGCSCQMCGNPRRTRKGRERITMQEHRARTE